MASHVRWRYLVRGGLTGGKRVGCACKGTMKRPIPFTLEHTRRLRHRKPSLRLRLRMLYCMHSLSTQLLYSGDIVKIVISVKAGNREDPHSFTVNTVSFLYPTLPTPPTLGFESLGSIFKTFCPLRKTKKKHLSGGSERFFEVLECRKRWTYACVPTIDRGASSCQCVG